MSTKMASLMPGPGPALNRRSLWKRIIQHKYFYLMFLPVLAWYIIFQYVPIYGIVMAFQNFKMAKGFGGSEWVGLANFEKMIGDEYFWRAFKNTFIISSYRLLFGCSFDIVVALALNEVRNRYFRKPIQTIIYLPHFFSWVIIASIFITMVSPERGIIKPLSELLGVATPNLLIDASKFRATLILSALWKESGFNTIIYIAAIAGIDPGLYEAAKIDGANRWKQMLHVTLPGISSTITILVILNLAQCLTWGFDQVYNLYNPMVYDTGDILDTYIVRTAMADAKFSYAAAIGLCRSVIATLLLLSSNRIMKKLTGNSIY